MTSRPAPRSDSEVTCRVRAATLAAACALSLVLTGCGGSGLTSGDEGYVGSEGSVTIKAVADREPPEAEIAGTTVSGRRVSLADHAGKVVVMPVWGSWCGPCRAEAPMLAAAARDLKDDGVVFLGINSRDSNTAKVLAFEQRFDLPYDSIHDPDGITLLAFAGTLPPMAIPSLVFIDAEGRVAARVLGDLDASTLYGVLEDLLERDLRRPSDLPTPGATASS